MARSVSRSAMTGRFVRPSTVARRPRTTVTQAIGGGSNGQYRSAITGRYVTGATAARHPSTTVREG